MGIPLIITAAQGMITAKTSRTCVRCSFKGGWESEKIRDALLLLLPRVTEYKVTVIEA